MKEEKKVFRLKERYIKQRLKDLEDLSVKLEEERKKKKLSKAEIKKLHIELSKEMDSRKKKLEFKINDFLTLKLENNKTFIYIKGKRFIQCIRLFLQIPPQTSNLYEEIDSIDEAAEVYKQSLWRNRIVEGPMTRPSRFQNKTITPEQEFWGHCSNIQVWAEHDYDTRLIHSNLVFQLLRELTFVGDPKAKAIFKEEIAIRFETGYFSVVAYLLEQGYLLFLDKDQLKILLENNQDMEDRFLENKSVLAGYGSLFLKLGDYRKAVKMLKKSLKIDPKSVEALFLIGIAYGILGDHRKASQSFKQTIQIFNSCRRFKFKIHYLRVYFELACYGLALSIARLKEYDKIFNLLETLKTTKAPLHIHKTVIDVFKRLLGEFPIIILQLIESRYIDYLSEKELREILENVKHLPPPQLTDEISLMNYGLVNIIIGDFTKAKYVLKDMLSKCDHKVLALCLLGITYGSLNQHEKAMQSFRKILEINDQYDIAWFGLGLWYNCGIVEGINAEWEYIRLIKLLTPEHSLLGSKGIEMLNSKISKTNSDLYKNWYEKTINTLESFVQINPSNAVARGDLVAIYHNSGIKDLDSTKLKSAINSFLNGFKWYELQREGTKQPPISNTKEKNWIKQGYDYTFKIVLCGEHQLAKTALIYIFCYNFYTFISQRMIGVDFHVKTIELLGKKIKIQLWDIPQYNPQYIPQYIRGANGAIMMYNITEAEQIKKISEDIELVRKNTGDIPIFLTFPELHSKEGQLMDLTEKYTFTEITNEAGPSGKHAFELLTKKILERFK